MLFEGNAWFGIVPAPVFAFVLTPLETPVAVPAGALPADCAFAIPAANKVARMMIVFFILYPPTDEKELILPHQTWVSRTLEDLLLI